MSVLRAALGFILRILGESVDPTLSVLLSTFRHPRANLSQKQTYAQLSGTAQKLSELSEASNELVDLTVSVKSHLTLAVAQSLRIAVMSSTLPCHC